MRAFLAVKMVLLWAVLLALPCGAEEERVPLALGGEWTVYKNPRFWWWHTLRDAPEKLGDKKTPAEKLAAGADGFAVEFPAREDAEGANGEQEAVAITFFKSEKKGLALLRCESASRVEIVVNQVPIYDSAWAATPGLVLLPVRQGENCLAVRLSGRETPLRLAFGEWEKVRGILPTAENLAAIDTSVPPATPERARYEQIIQQAVNCMDGDVFRAFRHRSDIPIGELTRIYAQYPLLKFYDKALDKVAREIPATPAPKGGAVLWMLYNMGYVVKTETAVFGIDLCHRRAHLLAPYLDFLLVTHAHDDHNNELLQQALRMQGKRIFSSFIETPDMASEPREITVGDIRIATEISDHNPTLKGFMTCYRITCGCDRDAVVIYHTGDSCDEQQINPQPPVDFHIVHPHVGLNVPRAVEKIRPGAVLFSHLIELGHCKPSPWFPVSFAIAYRDIAIMREKGLPVASRIPLWGEKIVVEKPQR